MDLWDSTIVNVAFAAMFVLVSIWESRCSKPRMDGIIWDRSTGRVTLIENIVKFMTQRKLFCQPKASFSEDIVKKLVIHTFI